jgi:hypothetical protein
MDDESAHLSPSEVRRALERLRPAEILRLSLLAQHWVIGLGRRHADDLLNEAFERVLSGRRPWPNDIATPAFFSPSYSRWCRDVVFDGGLGFRSRLIAAPVSSRFGVSF